MNMSKLFEKTEKTDFTTFPTTLESYAWYKPILIIILTIILAFAISFVVLPLILISPKNDEIIQLIYTALTVIGIIPAIFIGTKIVYKIPFSTQVAPIRKWNWGLYIKTFIITLIVYAVFEGFQIFASGNADSISISIPILLLCIILPIFQGFAEEYLCRGLLMQTFGSWFKIPIVAIVVQAAIFTVLHRYDIYSMISVLFIGLVYGLITWHFQGLESASAMHAVNNTLSFLAVGLGIQQGAGESSPTSLAINMVLIVIPILILLILDKKFDFTGSKNQ